MCTNRYRHRITSSFSTIICRDFFSYKNLWCHYFLFYSLCYYTFFSIYLSIISTRVTIFYFVYSFFSSVNQIYPISSHHASCLKQTATFMLILFCVSILFCNIVETLYEIRGLWRKKLNLVFYNMDRKKNVLRNLNLSFNNLLSFVVFSISIFPMIFFIWDFRFRNLGCC